MTILISALTACSSLIGFLIQATLARTFGVGIDMDMYLIALSAPLFGCAVLASAYSYGVVPQLVGIANERELRSRSEFSNINYKTATHYIPLNNHQEELSRRTVNHLVPVRIRKGGKGLE